MYRGLDSLQKRLRIGRKMVRTFLPGKDSDDIRGTTETADLMKIYTDSIYESGDLTKFRSVAGL